MKTGDTAVLRTIRNGRVRNVLAAIFVMASPSLPVLYTMLELCTGDRRVV